MKTKKVMKTKTQKDKGSREASKFGN